MPPRLPRPAHWFLLAPLACLLACNLDDPGDAPARATLYFPTAVEVSTGTSPRFLYVLNSNYDYRWSDGSLQAFDLDYVDTVIAECDEHRVCYEDCVVDLQACTGVCGDAHPCPSNCMGDPDCEAECDVRAECLDACGSREGCEDRCEWQGDCSISAEDALVDEALVPTHGTALALAPDGERLYLTSRTVRALTFVDVDESADGDAVLDCGEGRKCDAYYQRGVDNTESQRRTEVPADPVGIITGARQDLVLEGDPAVVDGNYIMMAHRGGAVSLFLEVEDDANPGVRPPPDLVHVRTGLLPDVTHIAYDANTRYTYLTTRQTVVDRLEAKQLSRVSVVWDEADPRASFVYEAGVLLLDGVSLGRETRALQFVDPQSSAAGAAAGHAMVISRLPPALLTVDVENEASPGHATVLRTTEVSTGPSRLMLGVVDGVELAFVSTFTARQIFIIDTATGLVRSIVPNLSGPFEIALDAGRRRLYVADFSSSVIRVVSLADVTNRAADGPTTARLEATLGEPRVVQELQ
jgi:DNA-binding beta-propeller fold protein YncE